MPSAKHASEMTGLSEFIDAWKAFQQTKSKLDGLQLLFVIDNIANRVIQRLTGSSSDGMIEADDLLPAYEALLRMAALPSTFFSEEHIAHFNTLVEQALDNKLRIASNALHISSILKYIATQKETAQAKPGGLTDEQQAALFNDVFRTQITPFSIDEHVETHVLPELEKLYKQISDAKQRLFELRRDKPSVSPEQPQSFDTLMEIDPRYSPESRDLIKDLLGTLHATQLFSVKKLKALLELPTSQGDQNPRQKYFEELLQEAHDKKKIDKEKTKSIKNQFAFFEQINRQLYLLNPNTLTNHAQELKIVFQLYSEAVLEDFHNLDEGLLKDFKDIENGRRRLLRYLLEHFKKTCGVKMDGAQRVLLSSIQSAASFSILLEDLKDKGILSENRQQETNQTDIDYAELLFNLQKGSFDVCQKFNAAVKNPDEQTWTDLKKRATEVNDIIDQNQKLLSEKTNFFPFLRRAYLKILRFFGLTKKRANYIAERYRKEMVPVARLPYQELEKTVTEMTQKQDTDNTTGEPPVDDETQNTVDATPAADTTTSTITVSSSSSTDVSKKIETIRRRTATLTSFHPDLLEELEETYQIEEVKEPRQQAEIQAQAPELAPAFTLIATVNHKEQQPQHPTSDEPALATQTARCNP